MGDVWRATDSVLGREVAVKVMRATAAEDPTFPTGSATRRAHSAGMSHQNIATVYDYGEDDGAPTSSWSSSTASRSRRSSRADR